MKWRESEVAVYLVHSVSLLWPGVRVPDFEVHNQTPEPITGWSAEEAGLLIEEGRRQLDQQIADLDRIRTRSQFVFTTALALFALVLATVKDSAANGVVAFCLWFAAGLMVLLSMLGSASSMASRSQFSAIDAVRLTYSTPPVKQALAESYSRSVSKGANTVATRLTLYRDAVFCILAGALLYATSWLVNTFTGN